METTETGRILKKYREEEHCGLRGQAQKLGISASYLCDISRGHRKLSIQVLTRIYKVYRYKCTGEDFSNIAKDCFDNEMFIRYKMRNHVTEDSKAIKDLIFIITGETL